MHRAVRPDVPTVMCFERLFWFQAATGQTIHESVKPVLYANWYLDQEFILVFKLRPVCTAYQQGLASQGL